MVVRGEPLLERTAATHRLSARVLLVEQSMVVARAAGQCLAEQPAPVSSRASGENPTTTTPATQDPWIRLIDQTAAVFSGIGWAFPSGGRIMKVSGLKSLLPLALLGLIFATAARAEETKQANLQIEIFKAKLDYCKTCHGLYGQGYHGAFPIPRLAGQQTGYFENQLRAFIERRRENKFMFDVAHVLSPDMITALANTFRDLGPKPLGGAPKELAPMGRKIYEGGIPAANIPACAGCHGPDAKGNGAFPRLAGQLDDYLFRKLVNWSKERGQDRTHPDTSAIMEPIAHGLNETQIRAVAAYLNYLE
jgi:cytochrome c553